MSVEPVSNLAAAGLYAQLARWRAQGAAAALSVRRLPATLGYLGALGAATAVISRLDPAVRDRLFQAASTNLDNLRAGHLSTLLTSAFVTADPPALSSWILLAGLLAGVEWLWGSWRAIGVFVAGHVGASLVVAAGLAVGVSHGWATPAVTSAVDVGISYGLMGLAGAATAVLPPALRPAWALTWLTSAVASVAVAGDFTSAGHLCALVIGLGIAAGALLRNRLRDRPIPRLATA